jgi:cation diffusion facilitator family transporter
VIVWRGPLVAAKPADEDHPCGHGKAEALSAAVIATPLLIAAVGIAAQLVREIVSDLPAPKPSTLAVLVAVVLIKELLFRFALGQGHATDSGAVKSDAWHHRGDAITSLAAAVGITLAVVAGPKWAEADEFAAFVAAGIFASNGWLLLRPALEELMDPMPAPEVIAEIRQIAGAVAGVDAIEKCFVRRSGWQLLVDMHIHVAPGMTVVKALLLAHAVKDAVRAELPKVREVLVHVEPRRQM